MAYIISLGDRFGYFDPKIFDLLGHVGMPGEQYAGGL